jgi:hypothetical protein
MNEFRCSICNTQPMHALVHAPSWRQATFAALYETLEHNAMSSNNDLCGEPLVTLVRTPTQSQQS